MARQYNKKSAYWNQPRKTVGFETPAPVIPAVVQAANSPALPTMDDLPHFSAVAACGGGSPSPTYRDGVSPTLRETDRYQNIREGLLPYESTRDGYYSVSGAIDLATRAYFNSAILRNAINLLQDYSISDIHIKCPNLTVKRFFTNWFRSINLPAFMAQFFMEYYRSGNVFIYKFDGKIPEDKFNLMKTAFSAKSPVLPVRYIILNPMQIYLQVGAAYNYSFVKMLSPYEINRLKFPKTEEDKAVLRSFPVEVQNQIKNVSSLPYIYVPLDPRRLSFAFYRKQDYEPLAVPMAFPVLNDIEWKMQLKKMDMSLARTVEQVILLITAGEKADEYNSAYNPKNLQALQSIFRNQTIGRVLVSDHTTKAEWKIPDLKELLGAAKYQRVDQDIKEGLQYMFFGEEKFANAAIKGKIFIEGLKEGRRVFLNDWLMPEVRRICEAMNFKNIPELEMEEIDIGDTTVTEKLYYQMAQLGLLTADELNTALETGVLPDNDESIEHQTAYKKLRDKGLYQPLLGVPQDGGQGRPTGGKGTPAPKSSTSPIGNNKTKNKKAGLSQAEIIDSVYKMTDLEENVIKALKKRHKIKDLNETQQLVATAMAKSIILNEPDDKWKESVASYLKQPKDIPADLALEIDEIGAEYDVNEWEAIVLWRAQIEEKP